MTNVRSHERAYVSISKHVTVQTIGLLQEKTIQFYDENQKFCAPEIERIIPLAIFWQKKLAKKDNRNKIRCIHIFKLNKYD